MRIIGIQNNFNQQKTNQSRQIQRQNSPIHFGIAGATRSMSSQSGIKEGINTARKSLCEMLQVIKEKYNAPTFADLNLGDIKMGSYQNFQPKVGPLKIGISDVTVEPYLEDGIRLSTHNQITQGERSYLIPKLDNLKYEVALPLSRKKSVTHDLEDFDGKKDLLKLMNDTVTALKPYATNAQKAT